MTDAPPQPPLVLVADDDRHIVELVSLYLSRAGFRVATAADGERALASIRELSPDLAVLDIMMPGADGLQICRSVARTGTPPVVLLTARSSDIDRVAGLRLGADDYVTKPFNPDELVARVEAVLRRSRVSPGEPAAQPVIRLGNVVVDPGARAVTVAGAALALTPREFDLLLMLARFPNVVLHRDQLLDLVWGTSFYGVRTVDVHIARLREKVQGAGLRIETSWGSGYRLVLDEVGP